MKRKNLKVGLRVELKEGVAIHGLHTGARGVVQEVEPDDYAGDFPCSVLFDGCTTPWWVELSNLRIADKVRKVKPSEQAPSTKMTWPWPAGTLVRLADSAYVKDSGEVHVLGSNGSDMPPVFTRCGKPVCFVCEGGATLAEDPEVAA